jgi:hypothetical protein
MGKVKDKERDLVVVLLEIAEVIGMRDRVQIAGAIKDTERRAA